MKNRQLSESTETPPGKGCAILFLAPFALVGVTTLLLGLFGTMKILQATTWTPVTATLEDYKLTYKTSNDISVRGQILHKLTATYAYTFEGKTFIGKKLYFGSTGFHSGKSHQHLYKKFKENKKIKIYVNSRMPSEAVVLRGFTKDIRLYFLTFFMFSLPIYMLIKVLHPKLRDLDKTTFQIIIVAVVITALLLLMIPTDI